MFELLFYLTEEFNALRDGRLRPVLQAPRFISFNSPVTCRSTRPAPFDRIPLFASSRRLHEEWSCSGVELLVLICRPSCWHLKVVGESVIVWSAQNTTYPWLLETFL